MQIIYDVDDEDDYDYNSVAVFPAAAHEVLLSFMLLKYKIQAGPCHLPGI